MKTIIEHQLDLPIGLPETCREIASDFNNIIECCIYSPDKNALRENMKSFGDSIYFGYGFGSDHMWVKQRHIFGSVNLQEWRLLLIEF